MSAKCEVFEASFIIGRCSASIAAFGKVVVSIIRIEQQKKGELMSVISSPVTCYWLTIQAIVSEEGWKQANEDVQMAQAAHAIQHSTEHAMSPMTKRRRPPEPKPPMVGIILDLPCAVEKSRPVRKALTDSDCIGGYRRNSLEPPGERRGEKDNKLGTEVVGCYTWWTDAVYASTSRIQVGDATRRDVTRREAIGSSSKTPLDDTRVEPKCINSAES
ncbi:hypothetical protein B0T17DRAFT_505643 [Bombardia bombarda]|uniref:Uncharacterized protein n=1 Tax=Bombardia bombarda TaxID=252184 RepID=A0AA39X820_9PEZI|nr:hypothetical protein B0T17DRAFT_505643 [Bombardia bombarda]